MKMNTYMTWVRDPKTGGTFQVTVQAQSVANAKMMFEGMYGKNVIHLPSIVN